MATIITIGGATQDIFAQLASTSPSEDESLVLSTQSKHEVRHLGYHPGGGAANTAAAFAQQGFTTSICALIGNDTAGTFVRKNLESKGIATTGLLTHDHAATGTSIILQPSHGNSAITTHRGANRLLCASMLPMAFVTSHTHLYITSLSGQAVSMLTAVTAAAREGSTLIACNPGASQLQTDTIKHLQSSLCYIDILLLNSTEAALYAKTLNLANERELVDTLLAHGPGIISITHGASGVHIYTKEEHLHAPSVPVDVIDTTGAGDAFGAHFVGSLIRGNSITQAMHAGLRASATTITRVGAQ